MPSQCPCSRRSKGVCARVAIHDDWWITGVLCYKLQHDSDKKARLCKNPTNASKVTVNHRATYWKEIFFPSSSVLCSDLINSLFGLHQLNLLGGTHTFWPQCTKNVSEVNKNELATVMRAKWEKNIRESSSSIRINLVRWRPYNPEKIL